MSTVFTISMMLLRLFNEASFQITSQPIAQYSYRSDILNDGQVEPL